MSLCVYLVKSKHYAMTSCKFAAKLLHTLTYIEICLPFMCILLHFSAKLRTMAMLIQLDRVVATPRYISKLRAPTNNYVHLSHYSNGLNVHTVIHYI